MRPKSNSTGRRMIEPKKPGTSKNKNNMSKIPYCSRSATKYIHPRGKSKNNTFDPSSGGTGIILKIASAKYQNIAYRSRNTNQKRPPPLIAQIQWIIGNGFCPSDADKNGEHN